MKINIGNIKIKNKINIGNIKLGIKKVYPELEDLEITPTIEEQNYKSEKYGYNNVTVKAVDNTIDENIVAENIKEGITILGVEGEFSGGGTSDTSDATATSNDILKDKTAYVDGNKIIGNIETYNEDISYMPHAEGKTFSTKGKYMASDIKVLPIETEIKTVNGNIDSFEVNASENKYMEQVKVDNSNLLEAIGSLNVVGETEETTDVTITDAIESTIEGLTIFGITDGTGQKVQGKNKFNYAKASNTANTSVNTYRIFEISDLKPNTQYVISGYDFTAPTTAVIYFWSGNTYANSAPRYFFSNSSNYIKEPSMEFTSNAEGKIYLAMYETGTAVWNEFIKRFKNAQIEEGTVATPYVPYNSIEIKVSNGEEQIATFPLGDGKTLGTGEYLTEGGRFGVLGIKTAYTSEQLTAWTKIKNLTLNEGTNHITTGGNLAPKFKLKYKQDSLEVIRNLLNN